MFDPIIHDTIGEHMGTSVDRMRSLVLSRGRSRREADSHLASSCSSPIAEGTGINIHKKTNVTKVTKASSGALTLHLDNDTTLEVDTVLWAIGRHAMTADMNLDAAGVKAEKNGDVLFDEWQETNVKDVFAIGDVGGKELLTPVALAAGRRLSNRLFGGEEFKDDKLDYTNVPS